MNPVKPLKIGFLGDIALNGVYVDMYNQGLRPFDSIHESTDDIDLFIGNLECLTTGTQGENQLKKPRLSTTVETLGYLKQIPVHFVTLAQNHIYDHLESGFNRTIDFLDKNDIAWLGAGFCKEQAEKPMIINHCGLSIAILNYVTPDTNPGLPNNAGVKLNIFELCRAIVDVSRLKATHNRVYVVLHWGGKVEGGMYPDLDQPIIARKLIDAGADMIVGHHSHTIQPFERYKGKYIFYSLGNFCFSNFVFDGKNIWLPPRRRITAILSVEIPHTGSDIIKIMYFRNNFSKFDRQHLYYIRMKIRRLIFTILKLKYLWIVYYYILRKINPIYFYLIRPDISINYKLNTALRKYFHKT